MRRDRLAARTGHRFALGAPARQRRQPAQDQFGVGDRLATDLEQRIGKRAGPMGGQQQAVDPARRIVGGRRLDGIDVAGGAEPPAFDLAQELTSGLVRRAYKL